MAITSLVFLGFCILSVIVFVIFPGRYRWIALLVSSLAFYWISAQIIMSFILFTSFTIYGFARAIDYIQKQYDRKICRPEVDKQKKKILKQEAARKKSTLLILALIINIGLLVAFKVFNYYTDAFVAVAGMFTAGQAGDAIAIIVPLGISYYTFSTVSYLLDVYWKRYECERNAFRFLLYTIYFPHIVQGPISRYNRLGQELKKPELRFTWNHFVVGMERILLGCFKKLVIADRASIFVQATMPQDGNSGFIYLLAIILDAIQIYFDFSGYMDIVCGVSIMYDVELEENFNHPFLATSVPDFWRRWHMSLGSWFKDYVYYPLTVSKSIKKLNMKIINWKDPHLKKMAIIVIPVMITWICTGLWHGTGYGYLMWGIYYGLLITISITFTDIVDEWYDRLRVNRDCFSYRVFQTIKIFCIFMIGRFLGTKMSLEHRGYILKQIFTSFAGFNLFDFGLDGKNFLVIMFGIFLIILIAAIERKQNIFEWFNSRNYIFRTIVILCMLFSVFLLGIYGGNFDSRNFMYQQY